MKLSGTLNYIHSDHMSGKCGNVGNMMALGEEIL